MRLRPAPLLAGLATAVLLGAAGSVVWLKFARRDPGLRSDDAQALQTAVGGPFRLTAPDGRIVTDRDFRGRWMVVYFGYTNCPDACPTALSSIANALDRMQGKARDIAPIFITVDPARDTASVMGHYVALFDRRITGLTGTQPAIASVEREYRVYSARHEMPGGGYTMDHSSILYVMNKQGGFDSFIDGAAKPETIAARLEKLDS